MKAAANRQSSETYGTGDTSGNGVAAPSPRSVSARLTSGGAGLRIGRALLETATAAVTKAAPRRWQPGTANWGGTPMSVIAWIILGLIAGFIASKIVNRRGEGIVLDIILGIIGAVVGGWIMAAVGGQGVNGFNLYSILVAIGGAIVVLVIAHAIRGGSASRRV